MNEQRFTEFEKIGDRAGEGPYAGVKKLILIVFLGPLFLFVFLILLYSALLALGIAHK